MAPGYPDGKAVRLARSSAARMHADDQAPKALGISIDEVGPGRATARMRVTGAMTNGHSRTVPPREPD